MYTIFKWAWSSFPTPINLSHLIKNPLQENFYYLWDQEQNSTYRKRIQYLCKLWKQNISVLKTIRR